MGKTQIVLSWNGIKDMLWLIYKESHRDDTLKEKRDNVSQPFSSILKKKVLDSS